MLEHHSKEKPLDYRIDWILPDNVAVVSLNRPGLFSPVNLKRSHIIDALQALGSSYRITSVAPMYTERNGLVPDSLLVVVDNSHLTPGA